MIATSSRPSSTMVHLYLSPWTSQLFVFVFVIFLVPIHSNYRAHHVSHSGIRSADVVSPEDFTDELFEKYGRNGSLDAKQLKRMFENLGIGKDNEKASNNHADVKERCFSSSSLLGVFSVNKTALNKQAFNKICPAIVQQIDSQKCSDKTEGLKPVVGKESKAKAWGYGFLAVFIISCASLFGAFVVPLMSKDFYKTLLLFMVSLAVGVLGGSGIFHLIPHSLGLHSNDGDFSYLYKCCVMIGGLYFFFCMEYIMKMYVRFKDDDSMLGGHGHSHHLSNDKKHQHQIPDNGIAEAQLEMYNIKQDHHHGHAESLCIGNGYFPNKPELALPCVDSDSKILSMFQPSIDIVHPDDTEKHGKKKRTIAPVAWMIVIGDGVHNFIDGLAIGAAFSTSTYHGISTALAIFCEELPHELGDFAVLLNAGMSYKQGLLCNFLSACTCFIGLVVGLLLGYSTSAVKWIYALAGGMFLYISLVDMLQEATEMSCKEGEGSIKKNLKTFALQSFGILFGFVVMLILALYAEGISI